MVSPIVSGSEWSLFGKMFVALKSQRLTRLLFTDHIQRMRLLLPARRLLCRVSPLVLALVLISGVAALAATLTLFTAAYDGASVRVDWEVSSETDVTGFELARKSVNETSFNVVTTVVPTGQRRYQYVDANVYRQLPGSGNTPMNGPLSGGPFTYRLTVRTNGVDQSYTTMLAGTPSAVQRSWGTIKSMFR